MFLAGQAPIWLSIRGPHAPRVLLKGVEMAWPPLSPGVTDSGICPISNGPFVIPLSQVEDFGWIKSMQSPNWSLLPEHERKAPSLIPWGAAVAPLPLSITKEA